MSTFFTSDHEWIALNGETGTIGITRFAQSQLGDITFVELPAIGAKLIKGDSVAVVDSVKAAADVYAPVSGTVIDGNGALEAQPELVNDDPEHAGWLFRVKLSSTAELDGLMDRDAYDTYVGGL